MSDTQRLMLLDTNVWADCYLAWRPTASVSSRLVDLALRSNIELLYAVHTLKDVYYIINRDMKRVTREETGSLTETQALAARAAAWGCIDNICENATAVGADNSDVWLARKYHAVHDDFEDNLILAAAQRSHADYFVTSDELLLRKSMVPAHTPQDAVALLELGLAAR